MGVFGKAGLKQVFDNFGHDITMTLTPFIMGSPTALSCFDEEAPCIMEQFSACTIKVSAGDQSKYVPWLICMDTTGETPANVDTCLQKVGLDSGKVHECQRTEGTDLLKALIKRDAPIRGTPTVWINGVDASPGQVPSYGTLKAALCKADP